jgi:hypothetical protein
MGSIFNLVAGEIKLNPLEELVYETRVFSNGHFAYKKEEGIKYLEENNINYTIYTEKEFNNELWALFEIKDSIPDWEETFDKTTHKWVWSPYWSRFYGFLTSIHYDYMALCEDNPEIEVIILEKVIHRIGREINDFFIEECNKEREIAPKKEGDLRFWKKIIVFLESHKGKFAYIYN